MSQTNPGDEHGARHSDTEACGSHNHMNKAGDCPRCRELEARIAQLEAAARVKDVDAKASQSPGVKLPPLEFKALRLLPDGWAEGWQLRPSPARRHWMDQSKHAYHCLPLVMANQWGWQILCPTDVAVTWDGSAEIEGVQVDVATQYQSVIKSHFGGGILTFSPPWLFRTPPGWDLYLKGPSNRWKSNCIALEGVIETWWLNFTFTLNWKLIEPGTVSFSRGESLGQLVPVPHATFENSQAIEAPIGLLEPDAGQELLAWQEKRRQLVGQKMNIHFLYRKAENGVRRPPPAPLTFPPCGAIRALNLLARETSALDIARRQPIQRFLLLGRLGIGIKGFGRRGTGACLLVDQHDRTAIDRVRGVRLRIELPRSGTARVAG